MRKDEKGERRRVTYYKLIVEVAATASPSGVITAILAVPESAGILKSAP